MSQSIRLGLILTSKLDHCGHSLDESHEPYYYGGNNPRPVDFHEVGSEIDSSGVVEMNARHRVPGPDLKINNHSSDN